MVWNLDFISEEDFKKHVRATIMKYGEKLESYDLKRFNSNLIDPIKLIFDKSVYRTSWEEIVNNEIFRQRDKSNNNDIGYFHQNIFLISKAVKSHRQAGMLFTEIQMEYKCQMEILYIQYM
ncbi:hypothetical protein HMPREF0990_01932 [Lachnospiraceae bacterium 1_1_57FAA]|nr:hypothetical protein HMPREF0990_01932 [Lachnospiraceae bacterium 1_1_57FAA]